MHLVSAEYEKARQIRDPRFDGQFFIGVLTTGIYCRPVCPARIPRKENIRLYSTAAGAADAGFRPCLRCRPESSPGTPAWLGTSHTVSRALQLIARGELDDGNVNSLANKLGVGSRHLSRLFKQHLGVAPISVAQTQRLHFAKKLLDETHLSMTDICFAAGFSSVRRFNSVFRDTWQRTPKELRKLRDPAQNTGNQIELTLTYRPPFDWRSMLEFLAFRSIPGVEVVTSSSYGRTIVVDGVAGDFLVRFLDDCNKLKVQICFPQTKALFRIVEKIRMMFDLKAVSDEIEQQLRLDKFIRPIVKKYSGLRVPSCWDGFEVSVRAIIGQQVSVKAATTIVGRIANKYGLNYESETMGDGEKTGTQADSGKLHKIFPSAEILANASLSGLGITTRRIQAIKDVAKLVCTGELRFDGSMNTEQFVNRITQVKGIGEWTAQYIALRALNDPNAFPHTDLILLRAAADKGETLSATQMLVKADAWKPWRAYVVMLLWKHYVAQHG